MATNASKWAEYVNNPKSFIIKKYANEILKDKFPKHSNILERVSHHLATEKDLAEFGQLLADIYEVAYMKAVQDHRDILAKQGLKVNVVSVTKNLE